MRIIFQKGPAGADRLICHRQDGSICQETLSVGSVYHDLAHYVEKALGMQEGVWGRIKQDYSMMEYLLPNEARPFQLTAESYHAEFLATLVQSAVPSGKVDPNYVELLRQVSASSGLPFPEMPEDRLVGRLIAEAQILTEKWEDLAVEEKLELDI
jgi:hypothetical protein